MSLATLIPRLLRCVSCGELLLKGQDVGKLPFDVQDSMQAHCESCAYEVLGIAIPVVGTLQHGTGGGWRVIKETKTH